MESEEMACGRDEGSRGLKGDGAKKKSLQKEKFLLLYKKTKNKKLLRTSLRPDRSQQEIKGRPLNTYND